MPDKLSIRPKYFDEYVGQNQLKENLKVFVKAAKIRNESLDHVLLYGPPGLGKTTMAYIIANELGVDIKTTSGPSIEKPGDLAAILAALNPGDVLFIDEIHRIPKFIEEILYPAMEDFCLDFIVGADGNSKSVKVDLPPFTLIGATTRAGDISTPLRERFGIVNKLNFYSDKEIFDILIRTSKVFDISIDEEGANLIASRSRGVPRIANNLFKRIRDFALVEGKNVIDYNVVLKALSMLKIDSMGLDQLDSDIVLTIIDKFNGGPVGISSLAIAIGEEISTICEMHEPYLIQMGFIKRTKNGRVVTSKAYEYFNKK
jgi:Holliday junction DNA helicase RuvB